MGCKLPKKRKTVRVKKKGMRVKKPVRKTVKKRMRAKKLTEMPKPKGKLVGVEKEKPLGYIQSWFYKGEALPEYHDFDVKEKMAVVRAIEGDIRRINSQVRSQLARIK